MKSKQIPALRQTVVLILTVYGIRISEIRSEGEIRNVWDLMEDYYSDTKDNSKVKNFLRNMSVFTRWYSYETGINNRFGDYEVSRN